MERLKTGQATTPLLTSPAHIHTPSNHPLSPTSPFTPQSPKPLERLIRRDSPPHLSINCYFDDVEVEGLEQDCAGIDEVTGKISPELTMSEEHLYPKPAVVSHT